MKKIYESLDVDVIRFDADDVITTSSQDCDSDKCTTIVTPCNPELCTDCVCKGY